VTVKAIFEVGHYLLGALAAATAAAFRVCFGLTPSSCKIYTTMHKYTKPLATPAQQF